MLYYDQYKFLCMINIIINNINIRSNDRRMSHDEKKKKISTKCFLSSKMIRTSQAEVYLISSDHKKSFLK